MLEGAVGGAVEDVMAVAGGQADGISCEYADGAPVVIGGWVDCGGPEEVQQVTVLFAGEDMLLIQMREGVRVADERPAGPGVAEDLPGRVVGEPVL